MTPYILFIAGAVLILAGFFHLADDRRRRRDTPPPIGLTIAITAALYIEGSPTVYLTTNQAKGLASALKGCAKDILDHKEINSQFQTFIIEEQ